jgi:hypothetical protein
VGALEVGDLVEVKKSNDLSPTLRFFHNKQGMVVRLVTESMRGNDTFMREWEILFAHGKRAVFKDYELVLISKAHERKK